MNVRNVLARCECRSLDHIVELSVWDDEPKEAYFTFHLKTWRSFWKRIPYAFRYLFGLTQRYGAWDEMCLTQDDATALHDALAHYIGGAL